MALPPLSSLPIQPDLPDLLSFLDGSAVVTESDWARRRTELRELVQHYEYGYLPDAVATDAETRFVDPEAFGGVAELSELDLRIGDAPAPVRLLLAVPTTGRSPYPTFVGANFQGNHSLLPDERIAVPGRLASYATGGRGDHAGTWPLERIVGAGSAVATFYAGDVDLDDPDVRDAGIRPWLDQLSRSGDAAPGAVSLWAWVLQRAVDVLQRDKRLDAERMVAIGHSRFGKVALLAAATDSRIDAAIPHQAGGGGTSPARSRHEGAEPLSHLASQFTHWFTPAFAEAAADPQRLPYDHHALFALMAPRPLLLSNAVEDAWADPLGQLELRHATEPVYELLGACDWADQPVELPEPGTLLPGRIGFSLRPGGHAQGPEDWSTFLRFTAATLGA